MFRPSYSHSQLKSWSSFLELSPLLLYFGSSPWMSWWSILLSVLTDLYEVSGDLNIWLNWVNALMRLWVRVHWSVRVVYWWSVVVVHILLISLIGWVKHKLVQASVSILWLLMLVWGLTVSCGLVFLSWVDLLELSGVWLCLSLVFEWWLIVSHLSLFWLLFLLVVRG